MTVYKKQNINCRSLLNELDVILLENGYEYIPGDAINDGRVYKSMGTSGKDEFYLRLKDPVNNYIYAGVYESYTPNPVLGQPGTFGNGYDEVGLTWNKSTNDGRLMVDLIVNVTADRLIIFCQGQKWESSWCHSLAYIGLPKRYDNEDIGSKFAGVAISGRCSVNQFGWKALKNRKDVPLSWYEFAWYDSQTPLGWGEQIFFSKYFIGSDDEGPRGELEDLYCTREPSEAYQIAHQDTFTYNGATYMAIHNDYSYNGNRTLGNLMYILRIG